MDHVGVPVSDVARSAGFYDAVLGVLGGTRLLDHGDAIGYGIEHPTFWILAVADGAPPASDVHLAFQARDADAVRAFHEAALRHGAASRHEPRLWPEYHARYVGGFVSDPDGNDVEAVTRTGEG